MFPGQGSQYKGMCKKLIENNYESRLIFKYASEILKFDLIDMINNTTMSTMTLSENAQPSVVVASYALYKDYIKNIGVEPECVIGHSLGEISALMCAESILFEDAIKLSRQRGKLMQSALERKEWGAGVVVDLTQQQVEELIEKSQRHGYIAISGYNASEQFVIAGERSALLQFDKETDKTLGQFIPFRMIPMKADTAYHSLLMSYCQPMMREFVQEITFSKPKIKVYSTVKGDIITHEDEIKEMLVNQLITPIKWNQTLHKVREEGERLFIDMGPNKLMYNLIRDSKLDLNVLAYDSEDAHMYDEILTHTCKVL